MLNGTLALYDVADVEAFVRRFHGDFCRSHSVALTEDRREEEVAELLALAWEASLSFEPEPGKQFAPHLRRRLSLRFIDYLRKRDKRRRWKFSDSAKINPGYRGQTVEREQPILVSIDVPAFDEARQSEASARWLDYHRLEQPLASRSVDPEALGDPGLARALERGASPEARKAAGLD